MTGEDIGNRNPDSPAYRSALDRAGIALPRTHRAPDPEEVARKAAKRAAAYQGTSIRIGEILGWRWWYVDELLKSPFTDCTWFPDEPMKGAVTDSFDVFGVYVMKDRGLAASQADKSLWFSSDDLWVWNNWRRRLPSPHTAYGCVQIWGEVIEHAAGYRAEFARVMSIDGVYPKNDDLLGALRAKYSVGNSSAFPKLKGAADNDEELRCEMSRQVTLNTNDGLTQIGTTILQSDFPETPQVLIWKGRTFISGALYGQEGYNETSHVELADDAVSTSEAT